VQINSFADIVNIINRTKGVQLSINSRGATLNKIDERVLFIMAKKKKARGYFAQRSYYYDTHDKDGNVTSNITPDEWKDLIIKQFTALDYDYMAMIFHDKDVLPDGNLKPLHVHALVKFKTQRYIDPVAAAMGITREQNIESVKSFADCARYLTHISESAINEGKTRYEDSDVLVYGDVVYSELIKRKNEKKSKVTLEEIDDFISELGERVQNGILHPRELKELVLESYNQTVWRKYRSTFSADFDEYLDYRAFEMSNNGRDLNTVYISGAGGSGKSSLAGAIAKLHVDGAGVHSVPASGKGKTYDMASKYHGEKVSVLNDIDSGAFDVREFLNVFDPIHYSPLNSRNEDKHWLAEWAILTNSIPLNSWLTRLMVYSLGGSNYALDERSFGSDVNFNRLNDKKETMDVLWQATRRIRFYVKIDVEKTNMVAVVHGLNWDTKSHEVLDEIVYPDLRNNKNATREDVENLMNDVAKKVDILMQKYNEDNAVK